MKYIFLLISILLIKSIIAQKNAEISLISLGKGASVEESRIDAINNSINKVASTFFTVKPQIGNIYISKNEINAAIENKIIEYKIIDENIIAKDDFISTIEVRMNLNKLNSFIKFKDEKTTEFDGSLFSFKLKLKELYKLNEEITIWNLIRIGNDYIKKSFVFSLNVGNPKLIDPANKLFAVNFQVTANANYNLNLFFDYLLKTLKSISILDSEINEYSQSNIPRYGALFIIDPLNQAGKIISEKDELKLDYPGKKFVYHTIILRSEKSIELLSELQTDIISQLLNFKISSGSNYVDFDKIMEKNNKVNYSRQFNLEGFISPPYSSIPVDFSIDKLKIVNPSWFQKDNSGTPGNDSYRKGLKMEQFFNKMLFDNNTFYKKVTDSELKSFWWPGVGKYYFDNIKYDAMEYSMPNNLIRILLSRFKPDFDFMNLKFNWIYTQDELSQIKNFKIEIK
jgi:hypothetical protein